MDTTSRTGRLVMGILALIAEFENDIRRERQMDGIKKARERGTRFGRKPLLIAETIQQVRKLRKAGKTVPEIMRQTELSKASVYRALSASPKVCDVRFRPQSRPVRPHLRRPLSASCGHAAQPRPSSAACTRWERSRRVPGC
ncbi:MAG: helix-turn-helix domain-containing protein [Methyloceanibacter sp.]